MLTKFVCLRVKWILRELWAKNVLKKDENYHKKLPFAGKLDFKGVMGEKRFEKRAK